MRRIALLMVALMIPSLGADWPQFRGNDGQSNAANVDLPTEITENSVKWKIDLPGRGPSGPIVVDDQVIVTASGGPNQDRLYVLSFDVASGEPKWRRQFWATGRTYTHPDSANAAPTPASDGERIFAFYSSNDLICLDLEGNVLWYRGLAHDYPKAGNDIGMSSSPLVVGDTVIVQVENQGDSFVAGINAATGQNRWRITREPKASWCSPIVLNAEEPGKELVVFQSGGGLSAYDAHSGEEIWRYAAEPNLIPSPLTKDGKLFLAAEGLTALDLGESRSATPKFLWSNNKLSPSSSSPVIVGDHVLTVNRTGVVAAGKLAEEGDVDWQLRLKGRFWATPVFASGHLYYPNSDGLLQVVKLGEEGEIVSEYDLGEGIQGSPAIGAGAMFIRSDKHLWKIAK